MVTLAWVPGVQAAGEMATFPSVIEENRELAATLVAERALDGSLEMAMTRTPSRAAWVKVSWVL